jgi:hypothetical protein
MVFNIFEHAFYIAALATTGVVNVYELMRNPEKVFIPQCSKKTSQVTATFAFFFLKS